MLQLAFIFQDNMILQRNENIFFWGIGDAEKNVSVEINSIKVDTQSDKAGKWCISFPALPAMNSVNVTITSEQETIVFHNVAIGEVWIAAGQSNMEFYMRYEKHLKEIKETNNERIRFFDVPEIAYEGQQKDFDYSQMGIWRKASVENIEYFSAVGYYFSRKLERELDVPIGIIGCNWGGTTSAAWMSMESINRVGKPWIQKYTEITKNINMEDYWRKQNQNIMNDRGKPFENPFMELVMPKTVTPEQLGTFYTSLGSSKSELKTELLPEAIPASLYEHMVKKIAPYTVKGVLWYQGESDDENGFSDLYKDMLEALISDWRSLWKVKLPFLIVQLPGFEQWLDLKAIDFPRIRECQKIITDQIEDCYLCSISDAGERLDIHPKDKKKVGYRLALLALGHIYGWDILCDAPILKKVAKHRTDIILSFKHAEGGLHIEGEEINALNIYDDCGKLSFDFSVSGEEIVIRLKDSYQGKLRIEFAKEQWFLVNLYNKSHIPAIPFEYVLENS